MHDMFDNMEDFEYVQYYLYIWWHDEQNRALLDTLQLQKSNTNQGHICLYSTLLIGHSRHPGQMRVLSWPFVPRKCNRQDMWSSCRQESLTALFSSGWTTSGSARYFFFSQWIQRLTPGWYSTNVPMFLCWRSTKVAGDQVIFYIFYILCIYCIFLC